MDVWFDELMDELMGLVGGWIDGLMSRWSGLEGLIWMTGLDWTGLDSTGP